MQNLVEGVQQTIRKVVRGITMPAWFKHLNGQLNRMIILY